MSQKNTVGDTDNKYRVQLSTLQQLQKRERLLVEQNPAIDEFRQIHREIAELEVSQEEELEEENPQWAHRIRLLVRPKVRAYYKGDRLFKSINDDEEFATNSIGLFVDFLFVAITSLAGNIAVDSDDISVGIALYFVTFVPAWRLWHYIRDIISVFEMNALSQRLLVLLILICLVGFATNLNLNDGVTPYMLVLFVTTARVIVALAHLMFAATIPRFRPINVHHALSSIIPVALWTYSAFIKPPWRYGIMGISFVMDWLPYPVMQMCVKFSSRFTNKISKHVDRWTYCAPAIDVDMQCERDNQFVALVLGNFILNMIYQNVGPFGFNSFFGKSVLGICIAFALHVIYFDADNHHYVKHAYLRHPILSFVYTFGLYITVSGLTLAGATMGRIVIASDCVDTDPDTLSDDYKDISTNPLPSSFRWLFSAAIGAALLAMGFIQLSHEGPPPRHHKLRQRLSREVRLAYRFVIGILWILLPLAGDNLNSLKLLSVIFITAYSLVFIEIYGRSFVGENLVSLHPMRDEDFIEILSGDEKMAKAISTLL